MTQEEKADRCFQSVRTPVYLDGWSSASRMDDRDLWGQTDASYINHLSKEMGQSV